MAKRSERVNLMVANLYNDYESGLTLKEIEKKYGVSDGYSYSFLDEVATNHGISKEYFFQKEHGFHVRQDSNGRIIPPKSVSFKEIHECLNEAEELLSKISKNLSSLKDEMEKTLKEIEEER